MIQVAGHGLASIVLHVAPRLASALLLIVVARRNGPAEAGVLALAFTYLLIATTVLRGLDELVVRQVSREPGQAARYLINFSLLRLILSLAAYGLVVLAVGAVFAYPPSTALPVLVLALSVVPEGLTYVAQAVLMAERRFHAIAVLQGAGSIIRAAIGIAALSRGHHLWVVGLVWLLGSCLVTAGLYFLVVRQLGGIRRPDWLDWRPLVDNWRAAASFVSITTLLAFESQTDTLVLSKFHPQAEVGWYGAATTLAFGLAMLPQAYRFSIYPLMARYALQSQEKLRDLYAQSLRYIGLLALPLAAGLLVLAPQAVNLIFGPEFGPAVLPLQILSLAFLFMFMNEPNSRMMLVGDRQRQILAFLIMTTSANVVLNLILVPAFGAPGAATARLISIVLFFTMNHLYVSRRILSVNLRVILTPAAVAVTFMVGIVIMVRPLPLPATFAIGLASYVALLVLLDRTLRNHISRAILQARKGTNPK